MDRCCAGRLNIRENTSPRGCQQRCAVGCPLAGVDRDQLSIEHIGQDLPPQWAIVTRLSNAVAERVRTQPGNEVFQEQIDEIRRQQERLWDMYVLGDTPRDQYLVLRAEQDRQIRELERQLGGASYSLVHFHKTDTGFWAGPG